MTSLASGEVSPSFVGAEKRMAWNCGNGWISNTFASSSIIKAHATEASMVDLLENSAIQHPLHYEEVLIEKAYEWSYF